MVAQSVEQLTLDFGSGHDLVAREFEPRIGLQDHSSEPVSDPVSLFLPLPHLCARVHALSLSLSKINKC